MKSVPMKARVLLGLALPILAGVCFSCASETDFKGDYEEASRPTQITGGNLIGMECKFIDGGLERSYGKIGCVILNENNRKMSVKPDKEIAQLKSADDIWHDLKITHLGPESRFSFVLNYRGDIPNVILDAQFITYQAKIQGYEVKLGAQPQAEDIPSTMDREFFVSKVASSKNTLCSREYPCNTINKALSQFPTSIQHTFKLNIANSATYNDPIIIQNKVLSKDSNVVIQGYDSEFSNKATVSIALASSVDVGILIANNSKPSPLSIHDFKITGASTGLQIVESSVILSQIETSSTMYGLEVRDSNLTLQGRLDISYDDRLKTKESSGLYARNSTLSVSNASSINVVGFHTNLHLRESTKVVDRKGFDGKKIHLSKSLEHGLYLENSSIRLNYSSLIIDKCSGPCISQVNSSYLNFVLKEAPAGAEKPSFVLSDDSSSTVSLNRPYPLYVIRNSNSLLDLRQAGKIQFCKPDVNQQSAFNLENSATINLNVPSTEPEDLSLNFCAPTYLSGVGGSSRFFINERQCTVDSSSVRECLSNGPT